MNKQEEYWSDYWQNDGQEGEVFVNSKGEKPDYIRDFWRDQLRGIDGQVSIVDLACGAGSIFEDLDTEVRSKVKLIAADISQSALDIVKQRVPEAKTICCSCEDLPFDDSSLEFLVSQFGIEYAGIGAFTEAASKVSSGGRIAFLCHYKGGYIDQRNAKFLEGAKLAISSHFIESASKLIQASYSGSTSKVRQAKADFVHAEKPLAKLFETNSDGIHNHLYFGFRQLYLKMSSYQEQDILSWLAQMKADIKKNIIKVTEIRKVSLEQADIDTIIQDLSDAGMQDIEVGTLLIPESENVVAWTISAVKC